MSVIGSNILAGASGQGGGYNLTRSLRFRSSASAYLNRTFTTPTSAYTWTYSTWVKRGTVGTESCLLSAGTSGTSYIYFRFEANGELYFITENPSLYRIKTNAVYRDPSAWYHIVLQVDTTQATAGNRMRLYVNGSQVTSLALEAQPPQNTALLINSATAHNIGRRTYFNDQYQDLYQTETYFIDGQALTPSSFGETSSTTGVWQPKKYTGTYGTNGFYLPFTDNSALTTSSNAGLGKDFSGNGNYWTTNNISITSGSTYDSMTDVPTLTSETQANYCVLNPLTGDATESAGNLNISGTDVSTIGTMAFPSTGKWYFEMTLVANAPSTNNDGVGIANVPINDPLPSGKSYYIYRSSGVKLQAGGSNTSYGASFSTGDVIGVAYDADAGTLVFYKNNSSQGTAFTGISGTFFPVIYARGTTSSPTLAFNAGQRPFAYTPPTGFVALNTYNLPTPTIGATASSQARNYENVVTYTGTGSSGLAITGVGFKPDLVWIKLRSTSGWHQLQDSVRGSGYVLYSNATDAEANKVGSSQIQFDNDGFTLIGSSPANGDINTNGATYVAWCWRANQGTNVTNTAGSITSTVSANTTSGFSIVTYTAQTSGTATIGHGLGVAPSMIIVKSRTVSPSGWNVYHSSLGATQVIYLNDTGSASTSSGNWNNTAPTSTVFTSGTGFANGGNMVAYCFSEVAGFSKFGKYTANGSTDGPFIYTGFRPKYVMVKLSSSAGEGWWVYDGARNTYNYVGKILAPNSSGSEIDSSGYSMDFVANGFKVRGTNPVVNQSGDTYIYMAFAENPFKYSLAR